MCHNGQGAGQSQATVVKWIRKAADQGLADAQSNPGIMYSGGLGVDQSHATAMG